MRAAAGEKPGERPFVDDYLLALMARASHAASADFHALLAAQGVPVPTWRVLATLHGAEAMPVGALAEVVLLKQPTLTKALDRMAAAGLIRREASRRDRRQALVALAPAGAALAERLLGEAKAHEAALTARLGADGGHLKAALRRVLEALDRR